MSEMGKSILIITSRPPYPLFSGGDHAQFHFIGELLKEIDVSVCFEVNDQNYSGYTELLKIWNGVKFYPLFNLKQKKTLLYFYRWIKSVIRNFKREILLLIKSQLVQISDTIKYQSFIHQPIFPQNARFVDHVAGILSENQFDVIQIDFISLAPLVYILPEKAVKILVHHEIRYIRIQREMDLFKEVDAFDQCRLAIIKDEEISLIKKFDKIITLTERDKEILSLDIPSEKIYASPATISQEKTKEGPYIPFKNKLVFIGSSIHLPNTDGLEWFLDQVLPMVEKQISDIRLEIIGRWDKHFIKKYHRKNINFLGYIKDLNTAFSSSILIVPIRIGSGMRLKIIEAINHQVPFISTTIGVEGLDFENDKDCIIADTPESFADGIVRLSKDGSGQQEFVNRAAIKLREKYSFESAIKKRLDFYKSLS
jgi:glycosyltransferase involved in cell wall biosynthesis